MRQFISTICFFAGMVCFSSSSAMLDLELTQGVAAAIPIALSASAPASLKVPGNQTAMQVVKDDLQNSGEFRVVNSESADSAVTTTKQKDWQKLGADYLVTLAISPIKGKMYRVNVSLSSTYKGSAVGEPQSGVLINQAFDASQGALRNMSHHISDIIYQKLIGVRGIFSTKIAYVLIKRITGKPAHYYLKVSDADGFNPETLLSSREPIMSPAWSPDGKSLAYVSFEGHHSAIYQQDLGTGQRKIISDAPGINGAPAFSPDGKSMALVLTKTGNPKIYVLNLSTKSAREITYGWSIDTEPAFSPDGKSILFTSNRDSQPQIYKYSLNNAVIARVTYSGDYNARASFFPKQQSMVMMHRENGLFGIARQDMESNQVQTLIQTGQDESPSLSPNGKMVIYATEYGGRGVLAQVSTDGRIKLRLPAQEGTVQEPAWSPFLN